MQTNQERRRHKRIPVAYECLASSRGRKFTVVCRDASPFGIGVFTNTRLEPNDTVSIRILIPGVGMHIDAKGEVVYCIDNPDETSPSYRSLMGIRFTEGPVEDIILPEAEMSRSRYTPSHTITIDANAKFCYKMLSDFERYPEWASGVEDAKVLERYPDGRGKRVEFLHDFFLRKVTYILDYSYDDDNNILSWVSAGGDEEIVGISGRYIFHPSGHTETAATYKLDVTLSIIPSKKLVGYVTNILMRREMKNFKQFVEKSAEQ
jgi:uncharacterized membrane protein